MNERRRAIHRRYEAALLGHSTRMLNGAGPGFTAHLAVLQTDDRDGAIGDLSSAGIATDIHYPVPDHRQPVAPPDARTATRHRESVRASPLHPAVPGADGRRDRDHHRTDRRVAMTELDAGLRPAATASTDLLCSIVVPVYRNQEGIDDLIAALTWISGELDGGLEAVFVVDGSPDDSLAELRRALPGVPFRSQLIAHSRNFGAFAAIRTGFLAARGRYIAAMAADLQEPIDVIREFFAVLATGRFDVVVGTRTSRDDPRMSRALSRTYWSTYRRLVQPQMPKGGVDVFACTADVAARFGELGEAHSSLIGLLYWLGYRRAEVPYARVARAHGRSAWTFRKRFSYLLDSVFAFTALPDRGDHVRGGHRDRRRDDRGDRRLRGMAQLRHPGAGLYGTHARHRCCRPGRSCCRWASSACTSGERTRTRRGGRPRS